MSLRARATQRGDTGGVRSSSVLPLRQLLKPPEQVFERVLLQMHTVHGITGMRVFSLNLFVDWSSPNPCDPSFTVQDLVMHALG